MQYQKNTKAIVSLVLGILSLIFIFMGYGVVIGIVMSIAGIIFGVLARKEIQASGEGQQQDMNIATAGLICSVISLVVTSLVFIACMACFSFFAFPFIYWIDDSIAFLAAQSGFIIDSLICYTSPLAYL